MSTAWTVEFVTKVSDALAREPLSAPLRDEAYHRVAALLSRFRLDSGAYEGPAAETLREDSVPIAAGSDWSMLKDAVRRRVLAEMGSRKSFRAALDAEPGRPDDDLQQTIDAAVSGHLPPVEALPPERLAVTLQVIDWFAGTELAPELPPAAQVRALLERESLIETLRELAGDHFRGRTTELNTLRAYVDAPEGEASTRAPLLIHGPGGMGKSTLVAHFILDSIGRLPLAYLDCDRPGLVATEPLTLLAEIVRQLALQFPETEDIATRLRQDWLGRVTAQSASAPDGRASVALGRENAMRELGLFLDNVPLAEEPFLLVIDTFEEVQYRARGLVTEILDFLRELQAAMPRLRTVLAGRNQMPGLAYEGLEIKALDRETAEHILASLGVAPEEAVEALAQHLRGNPLNLRLAAELWQATEGAGLGDVGDIADAVDLQGTLYGRILDHLHDEAVRSIAHPGLILRRITADIIMRVLAGPCGLGKIDGARANELFRLLGEEMSLVVPEGNAVRHRRDVRRLMLRALRLSKPDSIRQIEEAAIDYYAESDALEDRAEELYHRLSLNQPPEVISARWLEGVEEHLTYAVDELEGPSRAFLAARLGVELYGAEPDDTEPGEVDQATADLNVANQVRVLLELDKPLDALVLLNQRTEFLPRSPLFWLNAQVLRRAGFQPEAREAARRGLEDLLAQADGERRHLPEDVRVLVPLLDWYCGPEVVEAPAWADYQRQYRRLLHRAQLEGKAGTFFAGRRSEMAALDAYVSSVSTVALADRPPLFIHGSGGCGKTALVAQYLLGRPDEVAFAWLDEREADKRSEPFATAVLVVRIARQLGDQLPESQAELDSLAGQLEAIAGQPAWSGEDFLIDAIGMAIGKTAPLGTGQAPLLIIVDDFGVDEAEGARLARIAGRLQLHVPRLRLVFISRSPPPENLGFETLAIGVLDAEAIDAFLVSAGVEDAEARAAIAKLSSGHPLTMQLALGLYQQEGRLPDAADEQMLELNLLARLLQRLHDPDIARLAPAALIVRRLDRDVIRQVLAVPSGLGPITDAQAHMLYEKLAAEVALFAHVDNGIAARPDLRRVMLANILKAMPDLVAAVHLAAIAYYEPRESLADRAEEIFHRLAVGQDETLVDRRWVTGAERYLESAALDLPEPARAYLSARQDRQDVAPAQYDGDQERWELDAGRHATWLVERGRLEEALAQLRLRSTRLPHSGLFALEAHILMAIGQPREALAVLEDGLAAMPDNVQLQALLEECRAMLGVEEAASLDAGDDPQQLRFRALAKSLLDLGDLGAVHEALAASLPTTLDMSIAWRQLGIDRRVSMRETPRKVLADIIDDASARGDLEELLIAALAYAPSSPLVELAEGRVAMTRETAQPPKPDFVEGGLIFNRAELRRFIAGLAKSARERILLVDGPPGSGRSSTGRIARRFAADLQITRLLAIYEVEFEALPSAYEVTRNLFTFFDWRWDGGEAPPINPSPALTYRYARMIIDRFQQLQSQGATQLLIVQMADHEAFAPDVATLFQELMDDPRGPALILVSPGRQFKVPSSTRIETLAPFSMDDVTHGLERFLRERKIDGDSFELAQLILEQAANAGRYNETVSRLAHQLVHDVSYKSGGSA